MGRYGTVAATLLGATIAGCAAGPGIRADDVGVAGADSRTVSDSVEAMAAFRANIGAIHARDRALYLSRYLRSPRLARAGHDGVAHGYDDFAAAAGEAWPDTLVASHFQVTPVADGVVYGAYRYRVVQGGVSQRGVSERVLVRTADGWRIAVTTVFPAPPDLPPPPFALVGATLVDGTGAEPVADAVVVMRDGRIACAGTRASCPIADDVEVVDAAGRWIVPGLIDAHVHYSQTGWADGRPDALDVRDRFPYDATMAEQRANPERYHRAYLCSGVTAVFDVGGYPWTWALRDDAARSLAAPHVAAAGPLLSTVDYWLNVPGERQFIHMADLAATRAGARYLSAHGTDAIKIWFLVGPMAPDTAGLRAMVAAAGEAAERAGTPLIVHATGLWEAKVALEAGARLLVHSISDAPVDDELIELARSQNAVYTPTLVVRDGYRQLRSRRFDAQAYGESLECVDPGTRARAFLTDSLPTRTPDPPPAPPARRWAELDGDNMMRLHAAGVPVAVGTDAGNPLTLAGPSIYLEMEAMQEAGMSPMDVLVAATHNGALAMDRAADLGTVQPGKVADLVIVDADPTADIRALRQVALVVRGGEIYTRHELAFRD